MNLEEVLPLLRKGKKARCVRWNTGEWVYIRDHEFVYVLRDGEEDYANLCSFDIIGSEWEVFE